VKFCALQILAATKAKSHRKTALVFIVSISGKIKNSKVLRLLLCKLPTKTRIAQYTKH
jgi:hypothetical protein